MFRNTVAACSRMSVLTARNLSQTTLAYAKVLPSTPSMKSESAWTRDSTSNSSAVVSQVVGLARTLQESSQPPTSIDPAFTKRFGPGQSYDPFDFSSDKLDIQTREKRTATARAASTDPFERAGIDPLDVYTMPELLLRFLTSTGQILPREITGCNNRNQKRLAMAVMRARSCGLLSAVHRHSRYLPQRIL